MLSTQVQLDAQIIKQEIKMAYIILFKSIAQLYEAESILAERGIPNQLMQAPELPDGMGDSCGDNVLVVEDPDVAKMFPDTKILEISNDLLDL